MKALLNRALYAARDLRSRQLFVVLYKYCRGVVADVGGSDFVKTARKKSVPFERWIVVEPQPPRLPHVDDERVHVVAADGRRLPLPDETIDVVLSIQVLEHVFDPLAMLKELTRVVKHDGAIVVLAPQTANLHMIPHHYQNFTRFWFEQAANECGLRIVERHALGGAWSSIASRLVMQYPAALGFEGLRDPDATRPLRFKLLLPVGVLASAVMFPLAMLMSLGDLKEEPNNHLIVFARK